MHRDRDAEFDNDELKSLSIFDEVMTLVANILADSVDFHILSELE